MVEDLEDMVEEDWEDMVVDTVEDMDHPWLDTMILVIRT